MENLFSTIQVNGKYLEEVTPTKWTDDELFAKPLRPNEVVDVTKRILALYSRHERPCKIIIERIV